MVYVLLGAALFDRDDALGWPCPPPSPGCTIVFRREDTVVSRRRELVVLCVNHELGLMGLNPGVNLWSKIK